MNKRTKDGEKGRRGDGERGKKREGREARGPRLLPTNALPSPSPPTSPSPRLPVRSVAIIGAGRLGGALAGALDSVGYHVNALVARRLSHAKQAARGCPNSQPLALSSSQLDQLPESDLLIITTPDDLIGEVAERLADAVFAAGWPLVGRRNRTVLHASGALASDVLLPLRARGFAIGSLHPLASVSSAVGGGGGADNLRGAFFCVEGDRAAVSVARRITRALGGQSFSIKARDKALYHAAAVLTAGHAIALFDIAAELLTLCGLTPTQSRRILQPLLQTACTNLRTQSPSHALTGTFARADLNTVTKHVVAFREHKLSDALNLYVLLGQHSLKLAKESGVDRQAIAKIARALLTASGDERQRGDAAD